MVKGRTNGWKIIVWGNERGWKAMCGKGMNDENGKRKRSKVT